MKDLTRSAQSVDIVHAMGASATNKFNATALDKNRMNLLLVTLCFFVTFFAINPTSRADDILPPPAPAAKVERTACAAIGTRITQAIGGTLNNTGDETGSDAYIDMSKPAMSIIIRCPEGKFITIKDYDERIARPLVLSVAVKALAVIIPSKYWSKNLPARCISSAVRASRSPVKKMGRAHWRELTSIPYFEGNMTLGDEIELTCSYDSKENLAFIVSLP